MEFRDPVFTANGYIDMEINHPDYGWIPFTASPDDTEPHGQVLFDAAQDVAAEYVPPEPAPGPTLEELRAKAELDRYSFALRVAELEFVSPAEAAQWAAGNAVPANVQAVIDGLPEAEQGAALIQVLAKPIIERTGDLMGPLALAFGTDDVGLDEIFSIETEPEAS